MNCVEVIPLEDAVPQSWERTHLFCPRCGTPGIWNEEGGDNYLCLACGFGFCGLNFYKRGRRWNEIIRQIVEKTK